MADELTMNWKKMIEQAGMHSEQAFHFVREGLAYTVEVMSRNDSELAEEDRHVSGQELCLGLRDFAIKKYGALAGLVLSHWRIRRTDDFGRIVFAMVDAGLMRTTEEDTLEDFQDVYDFDEAFNLRELAARH